MCKPATRSFTGSPSKRSKQVFGVCAAALLSLALSSLNTAAFEELSEAQSLVYQTAHLSQTSLGQKITYDYTAAFGQETMSDVATINIDAVGDDDKRDVAVNFLSEERRLTLPAEVRWLMKP